MRQCFFIESCHSWPCFDFAKWLPIPFSAHNFRDVLFCFEFYEPCTTEKYRSRASRSVHPTGIFGVVVWWLHIRDGRYESIKTASVLIIGIQFQTHKWRLHVMEEILFETTAEQSAINRFIYIVLTNTI